MLVKIFCLRFLMLMRLCELFVRFLVLMKLLLFVCRAATLKLKSSFPAAKGSSHFWLSTAAGRWKSLQYLPRCLFVKFVVLMKLFCLFILFIRLQQADEIILILAQMFTQSQLRALRDVLIFCRNDIEKIYQRERNN